MSEEERRDYLGNTNPEDNRQPGAGGGEQPASYLMTNEPIDRPGARSGFETGDTERNAADDSLAADDSGGEREQPQTIADKLVYAREQLGDDVFVLEEGSEIFNTSGLRVVLVTPSAVRLESGSPDPATNDQRFASFLHPSDRNWGLNIKQLERPYDRARNVALPLMCETHGEDLEWEAYGRPRQCPKCAQEALALAAEIGAQPGPQSAPSGPIGEFPAPAAEPELLVPPITVGSVVKLREDEAWPAMTVVSIEFGIALCQWFEGDGREQEKTFGVTVLRPARPGEIPGSSEPESQA